MKIRALEAIVFQLPGRTDYTWRSLEVPIGRYVLLRIETDEGIVGFGEAPAILSWGGTLQRYYGEDPEIVVHLVDSHLRPLLEGRDPTDVKGVLRLMDVGIRGFPYTKAMVESALLDITGKAKGIPVYQILGGAARQRIQLCHSVGIAAPEVAADEARQVVEDGIKWLQVKVPGEPATDSAIVKAIRRAVGAGVMIYPDVNRGYPDAKTAIRSIRAMIAEADIFGVEQPVESLQSMRKVARALDIPVLIDEGCWTPHDATEIVANDGADILSIYYTKAGGMIRSMEIGAIARSAGLAMNVNGSLEAGVGNAANLHLAAALEGNVLPGVITVTTLAGRAQTKVGGVFYTDDLLTEPFEYSDGYLEVPEKPGLGVEIDEEKLKKYRLN